MLFFSTHGKVYRLKVWRLPEGAPQARGRPMVNLLPLAEGETISNVLPLPEDEEQWSNLHVIVRNRAWHGPAEHDGCLRQRSDGWQDRHAIRRREGDPTDRLIGVSLLSEEDDVLLATRMGSAIRFAATDVREFQSRTAAGVRGIRLRDGDEVISVSILKPFAATLEERDAYLRSAPWKREPAEPTLSSERMEELAPAEDFILTVSSNGYGKRTSAYEFRRNNRGGLGYETSTISRAMGMWSQASQRTTATRSC